MSGLLIWSVTDGDDRVNAKDGLDDTAIAIAAPAMAARAPLVIRRAIMVSSRLPSDCNFRACGWTGLKRSKARFVLLFHGWIVKIWRENEGGCHWPWPLNR
jgi:hypothetical protein